MRGRVSFEVDGHSHELRFSTNNMCRLEEATGKGVIEFATLLANPQSLRMTDLRRLMWAGLADASVEQAGDLIDDLGMERAADLIGQAFEAAFPASDGEDASGNAAGAAA